MPRGVFERTRKPAEERFWRHVNKDGPTVRPELGPCEVWTGGRVGEYGAFHPSTGVSELAHRWIFARRHGPIPEGFHVLHRCDNPPCIRDEHHFLGTPLDNSRDCIQKGRSATGDQIAHHGEGHGMSKLTWALVYEIRRRHPKSPGRGNPGTLSATARELGVTSGLVSKIVAHHIWREEWAPSEAAS